MDPVANSNTNVEFVVNMVTVHISVARGMEAEGALTSMTEMIGMTVTERIVTKMEEPGISK